MVEDSTELITDGRAGLGSRSARRAIFGSILTLASVNLPLGAASAQTTPAQSKVTGPVDLLGLSVTLPRSMQGLTTVEGAQRSLLAAGATTVPTTELPANLTAPKPRQQGPVLIRGTVHGDGGAVVTDGFVLVYIDDSAVGPTLIGSSQITANGQYSFSFGKEILTPSRVDASGNAVVMVEPVDGVTAFGPTRHSMRLVDATGNAATATTSTPNASLHWVLGDTGQQSTATAIDLAPPKVKANPSSSSTNLAAAAATAPPSAYGCAAPAFPAANGAKTDFGTGSTSVGLEEIDPNATYWTATATYQQGSSSTYETGVTATAGAAGFSVSGSQTISKSSSNSAGGSFSVSGRANTATATKNLITTKHYQQRYMCIFYTPVGIGVSNFDSAREVINGEWVSDWTYADLSGFYGNNSFGCPAANRNSITQHVWMTRNSGVGLSNGWSVSATIGGASRSFTGAGTIRITTQDTTGVSVQFTNTKKNSSGLPVAAGLCSFSGVRIFDPSFVGNIIAEV